MPYVTSATIPNPNNSVCFRLSGGCCCDPYTVKNMPSTPNDKFINMTKGTWVNVFISGLYPHVLLSPINKVFYYFKKCIRIVDKEDIGKIGDFVFVYMLRDVPNRPWLIIHLDYDHTRSL